MVPRALNLALVPDQCRGQRRGFLWNYMKKSKETLEPGQLLGYLKGVPVRLWVDISDLKIPKGAKAGETIGWCNCSCGRVHEVRINNQKEKVMDTGWY